MLLAIAAVSGCAVQPPEPPPDIDPMAVCYSKPQCDAMWSEAMVQIQSLSGMRLQTATDTYIQTFNATGFGRLSAVARKIPKPDGSTVIDAGFSCGYCGNLSYQALNLFTGSVKFAGQGFEVPEPPDVAQEPKAAPTPTMTSGDDLRIFSSPRFPVK